VVTVVVVVGTTTGAVVVVAGAGGAAVGNADPRVDVSAVPAVLAPGAAAAGAVVVVDRAVDVERGEPPAPAPPSAPCESLDCALAIPRAPGGTRRGLPEVATRSAIKASDTARMTHQLGRPRTTLGRRPSEDPVP
jgi:hypothetical protein